MTEKWNKNKTYNSGDKFKFGNTTYIVGTNKGRLISVKGLKPKESEFIKKAT